MEARQNLMEARQNLMEARQNLMEARQNLTEEVKQKLTEKIYAGLIGMDAGMRLGAPVENPFWTYERLRDHYGDIRGYLRVHKNHTADDDVNGPILLVRALTDKVMRDNCTICCLHNSADHLKSSGIKAAEKLLTPDDCGEAWLNYTRFGKGMFWWGGEDLSTEHRAYMNLRRGLKAPESGSSEQNGKTASEQIGGQIFSDTWGLICPGDPEKAAVYARTAASVSHDGNGLHGAAFMAASVAAAFGAKTVDEVIDAGLRVIPSNCDYAKVVHAVRYFHAAHPHEEEFRACRNYIEKEWGHDKFPGGWHIIPNAGICITGLLYGDGDLGRSIEISVMCGFDTDCNASNIGTILGVFGGLEGVPERYREPIRDTVILSGISGYLNMVDLPSLAHELADVAFCLHGQAGESGAPTDQLPSMEQAGESGTPTDQLPSLERAGENCAPTDQLPSREQAGEGVVTAHQRGNLIFDFSLPGSTHGLRLSDRATHSLRNVPGEGLYGKRCLELMIDGKRPGPADLYFSGCFIRSDLEDERYEPVFSPRVYPGQTVFCRLRAEHIAPAEVTVVPFVTCAMTGRRIDLDPVRLPGNAVERTREAEENVCGVTEKGTIGNGLGETWKGTIGNGLGETWKETIGKGSRETWKGTIGKASGETWRENWRKASGEIWRETGGKDRDLRDWSEVVFTVPDLGGDQVHELGWRFFLKPDEDPWALSKIYIDQITVTGPMDYTVDFSLQREEFGEITPFSFNDCNAQIMSEEAAGSSQQSAASPVRPQQPEASPVRLQQPEASPVRPQQSAVSSFRPQRAAAESTEKSSRKEQNCRNREQNCGDKGRSCSEKGQLYLLMNDDPTACGCQAFTGNYYQHETCVTANTRILEGNSAMLLLRGQGARRYYALGIVEEGKAAILRYEGGTVTELAVTPFPWNGEKTYCLEASASGQRLALSVDGKQILAAEDSAFSYGMVGLGMCRAPGKTMWSSPHIRAEI